MKKVLPYLFSIVLGTVFGFILFQDTNFNIKEVFSSNINATAFQLGVFNNEEGAKEMKNRYENSIIMKDDDVYRVYYSILTSPDVITKMEKYLSKLGINYYLKQITVTDSELIKAISEYESTMAAGSDNVLTSINNLIMSSYGGENGY